MSQTLDAFQNYQKKIREYEQAVSLLYWDLQTLTPKMGAESKADSIGFFSTEAFRLSTADEYGELLKALSAPEEFALLNIGMQTTVRRNLRDFERFKSESLRISIRIMSPPGPAPAEPGKKPSAPAIFRFLSPGWTS